MQDAWKKLLLNYQQKETVAKNVLAYHEKTTTDISTINWVWVKTVEKLLENWINTIELLANTPVEKLEKIVTNKITLWIIKKYITNFKKHGTTE